MLNKLVELEKFAEVKNSKIPKIYNEFSYSEIVAEITYKCGLNVIVFRLKDDYTITYEYDQKTWPGYCSYQEDVLKDVEINIKNLHHKM